MTLIVLMAALGAAMGSFAALVAERILRGEGWALGRSRCRSCHTELRAADLVPILSWWRLGGACRHCAAPIPAILLQAEITGALMGAVAAWVAPDPARGLLLALWMWSLLALACADLRRFRLPEPLMALTALLGLALALAGDGSGWPPLDERLTSALWGAAIGGGAFWTIRTLYRWWSGREGMGLGDVLLLGALGLALGPARLPLVVLFAAGTALALALLRARRKGRSLRRLGRLPFGAALALAGALVAVIGPGA